MLIDSLRGALDILARNNGAELRCLSTPV